MKKAVILHTDSLQNSTIDDLVFAYILVILGFCLIYFIFKYLKTK